MLKVRLFTFLTGKKSEIFTLTTKKSGFKFATAKKVRLFTLLGAKSQRYLGPYIIYFLFATTKKSDL